MTQRKSLLTFSLAILFFTLPGQAQTVVFGDEATHFFEYTVATRPVAPPVGWIIIVTNGAFGSDCNVGGGGSRVLCRWTGAAWESIGGGAFAGRSNFSINLLSPTAAETNLIQNKFPNAVTLRRVSCSVDSGTSVVIQFDERAEATPNVAGTDVLTGNLTCDTTNGGITAAFTNAGIAANAPLNLQIISSTANPNAVRIHVEYTVD